MSILRKQPAGRSLTRPGPGVTQPADDRAAAEKARLRPLCRERRNAVTGEARENAQRAMLERLFASPMFREASVICAYASLPGEIDLYPVWRRAEALGKRFALPCTREGSRDMLFRTLPGYAPDSLVDGPHHTRQPGEECPVMQAAEFAGALILVPGLSFDEDGVRLGYGRGYYDRFLRELYRRNIPRGIPMYTAGLAFEACMAVRLPREAHDIPVQYVLTEGRMTATHADPSTYIL